MSVETRHRPAVPSLSAAVGGWRNRFGPPLLAGLSALVIILAEACSWGMANGIGFLYLLPVAVLAVTYGRNAGFLSGAVAFCAYAYMADLQEPQITTTGFVVRGIGFLALGGVIGSLSDRQGREHAQLDALIEEAPEAIIRSDAEGKIVRANGKAEELFGYPRGELVGHQLGELMPAGGDGAHTRVEITGQRKNGTSVAIEAALGPLGDRQLTTSIFRDVSERRKVEAELEASRLELAARADDLERSNAELEQFAYIASHDLSEPLRVVAGFVGLLKRRYGDQLDEEGMRFIDTALTGTDRMQALIDALLAYSRVGTGDVQRQRVCSETLVRESIEGLERQIEERGVEIEIDELPMIDCEPSLAGQLFQNLISNAVKFADGARPRVKISATKEPGAWRFSVIDNGDGIEEERAEEVFELFRRFHGPEVPGTGIGLAVCKRIVERHGGEIRVEAAPNGGSVFTFTIADADAGSQPA